MVIAAQAYRCRPRSCSLLFEVMLSVVSHLLLNDILCIFMIADSRRLLGAKRVPADFAENEVVRLARLLKDCYKDVWSLRSPADCRQLQACVETSIEILKRLVKPDSVYSEIMRIICSVFQHASLFDYGDIDMTDNLFNVYESLSQRLEEAAVFEYG